MPTYAACLDYASILQSCASATSSFYALPASEQVSCACYTPTISQTACSISQAATPDPSVVSSGGMSVSVPTLAASRIDDAANNCRDYFGQQGYTNLASALSGIEKDNEIILGAAFCANVGSKALETATTTYRDADEWWATESNGLPMLGKPTPFGECQTLYGWSSGFSLGGGNSLNVGTNVMILVSILA